MKRPVAFVTYLGISIIGLAAGACGRGLPKEAGGLPQDAAGEAGDAGGPPRDAAVEASDAREVGTFADQCGLIAQDCPSGQLCDHDCVTGTNALTCLPDRGGTGMHGDTCSPSNGCAKGNFCAIFLMIDGGSRTSCAKYCNTAADCPGGLPCQVVTFRCADPATARRLGVCVFAP
jgi:hypothetical protein